MMSLKVTVLLVLITKSLCYHHMCDDNSVDISRGTHLTNGDVYFNGVKYDKSEYYLDSDTGAEKACVCMKQKCLRKCCPLGTGYNYISKTCDEVTDIFDPPVWNEYRVIKNANASSIFHFLYGKVNCTLPEWRVRVGSIKQLGSKRPVEHRLRMDGKLYVEVPLMIPPWVLRGPDKYCLDTFVYEDENGAKHTQLDALVCFAEQTDDRTYKMSSACMLVSCVFILATVAVYAWLPELRNLHGRVLMAYLLCLFVGFLFMSTMQILLMLNNIGQDMCVWMTFVIYFFLLSAFFWLNVMCFDIWWTFSGKRGLSARLSIRARFCAYALYAFSVPSLLTVIMAGLEFSGLLPHALLPNIKYQGCFLFGTSKLLYLYGPIVILCIANMVFFILTAIKINQIKRQTSVLKSGESAMHDQHRNDTQRLLLYVKLFVVMGINWLLEVISAIYPDADDIWRYTDAYNVLIGLIIFIIFVCKRKIFRLIKKRIEDIFHGSQSQPEDIRRNPKTSWRTHTQRSSNDTIKTSISSDRINAIATTKC